MMNVYIVMSDPETIFSIREFVGPVVGAGLTNLLNFRVAATVSKN